jgi:Uma2 family endonuclease
MTPSQIFKEQGRFTYADYLSLSDDERWELIDGEAYSMSPAPNRMHQKVSAALFNQLYNHLKGKTCETYSAPFDVRLPGISDASDDETDTVVQPDIVVICDPDKLDDKGCNGAPDLIVEILSPSTAEHDMKDKFYLYQRVGVLEYWIVNQTDKTLMVFKLNSAGEYCRPEMYGSRDIVAVPLLGDLEIDLAEVFAS